MENKRLTDEEVRALKTILVKGNEKIVALHFGSGYYGRGGSNLSPFTDDIDCDWELERFADQPPHESFGFHIRAIVNDVVYLTNSNGKVISFDENGKLGDSYEVAYDTMMFWSIRPVVKDKKN